jgi:hypothetical protein
MPLSKEDLVNFLKNYARLETAGAKMFREWSHESDDPEVQATLKEFAEIELRQAGMIAEHVKDFGEEVGVERVPFQDSIESYLLQINSLDNLAQKLRYNYMVMSVLERPIVVRALLESTNKKTLEMFEKILDNEDRILGWCDNTATRMGCEELDVDRYFGQVRASV